MTPRQLFLFSPFPPQLRHYVDMHYVHLRTQLLFSHNGFSFFFSSFSSQFGLCIYWCPQIYFIINLTDFFSVFLLNHENPHEKHPNAIQGIFHLFLVPNYRREMALIVFHLKSVICSKCGKNSNHKAADFNIELKPYLVFMMTGEIDS